MQPCFCVRPNYKKAAFAASFRRTKCGAPPKAAERKWALPTVARGLGGAAPIGDGNCESSFLANKKGKCLMSNVNENLKMLFTKMEDYVSTKTVVGEAVHIGNVILVPLVDVAFGMGTGLIEGAGEKNADDKGGGAMGAKMTPSAVIVIVDGTVQLVNVKSQESVNKLIDMVPGILSKLNLGSMFGKKKNEEAGEEL